ncbi:type ISP restriction/modification enzyme [Candidatus Spongiihabitans sp.]|uniref:type ISP restriction/modification enzyme n=1 Tax=Candidatus Spongiihabitans sp. TaxID=3101308 RepID=UPI003C6ECD99
MTAPINEYLKAIGALADSEATEFSFRTPVENMLETLAPLGFKILQEPSRIRDIGAPDFLITNRAAATVGYVECKKPGENLQVLAKSAQMERYRSLSPNIILTDYSRFMLLHDGKVIREEMLSKQADAKQKVVELITQFFTADAQKIGTAKDLANALAVRCGWLRHRLEQSLRHEQTRLHGLMSAFKEVIYTDIDSDQFADALAQTLVYGLLMAKLKAPDDAAVDLYNVEKFIPQNFALIREITGFLKTMEESDHAEINYLVQDILATVNAMDRAAVTESMSYRNRRGLGDEDDPYIYFYENFLAAYDTKLREQRGVYYTPPPVVRFIVRAVDKTLRTCFKLPAGLANEQVTALDFAAGTGTFLLEMMRHALEGKDKSKRNQIVRWHLLKNFHGFEYLIAPYVIAHLKLSQYLTDVDATPQRDERINVFLTNTLEQIPQQVSIPFMPALTRETEQAQKIKEKEILVIVGNPPYSGHSQNNSDWITNLIEEYKKVDGQPLGERNPKMLQDDYVKFIRFAQWKMEQAGQGMVAIITNHGFLDNPTFRGMRQSLQTTFDRLYFLDLHGNARKKETAPDGGQDQNVFDIQQGVAISILIKKPGLDKGVFHGDLWGERAAKYQQCAEQSIESIQWKEIKPVAPFYLFIPRDNKLAGQYEKLPSIIDIFQSNSTGIKSHRDHFAFAFCAEEIKARINKMIDANIGTEDLREIYNVKDTRDWKLDCARQSLINAHSFDDFLRPCLYRPFDIRWCYYGKETMDRHRPGVMRHILAGENLGLATVRQVKAGKTWQHCLVSTHLIESTFVSNKTGEITYLFPLYRYDDEMGETIRHENLKPKFRQWIDARYGEKFPPEQILGCIYAVLHSPDYRQRYADFLRMDYPRIPFPSAQSEFIRLAAIGNSLIAAHLLKANCYGEIELRGEGTAHRVERIHHDPTTNRLHFNKTEYLAPLAAAVFNFQIGGYRPLEKFLKSRKNRVITKDIDTLEKAANVIAFTIEKIKEIDG